MLSADFLELLNIDWFWAWLAQVERDDQIAVEKWEDDGGMTS